MSSPLYPSSTSSQPANPYKPGDPSPIIKNSAKPAESTLVTPSIVADNEPDNINPLSTITPSQTIYYAQSGDSLSAVAKRFDIDPKLITSPDKLPRDGLLTPGQALYLPPLSTSVNNSNRLLPDSEIINGPSAVDFHIQAYLESTNGFLRDHREYLKSTGWTTAADIINRLSLENSINPRIFLSLLEDQCHCVLGQLNPNIDVDFLLGNYDYHTKGLYRQLAWAATRLSVGYYGWRAGDYNQILFANSNSFKLAPDLNAGSVAIMNFYAFYEDIQDYGTLLEHSTKLAELHDQMFGDAWERDGMYAPIFPAKVEQPELILPFEPGRVWSYSSGPHTVWEKEGAEAAIDFAPATYYPGCVPSDAWVVAMSDGLVAREEYSAVILDVDEPDGSLADGLEQTGWVILYLHIESRERVTQGIRLKIGDRIGHPSCEGGRTTGTHVHIARKYNGEWVLADGMIPFIMEGWVVHAGIDPYQGTLTKNAEIVVAHPYGSFETCISRATLTPTTTP